MHFKQDGEEADGRHGQWCMDMADSKGLVWCLTCRTMKKRLDDASITSPQAFNMQPLTCRTVKKRLDDASITSPQAFIADMKLIFQVLFTRKA